MLSDHIGGRLGLEDWLLLLLRRLLLDGVDDWGGVDVQRGIVHFSNNKIIIILINSVAQI